jgi:uncharacterized protein
VVAGNVDFALAGTILLGSLPGVWIGSGLMPKVPAGGLRATLALVLFASALGLVAKAGAPLSPGVILGLPVLLGVVLYVQQRTRSRRRRERAPGAPAVTAEG